MNFSTSQTNDDTKHIKNGIKHMKKLTYIYKTWHATYQMVHDIHQTWNIIHALRPLTSQIFTNSAPH